MASTITTILGHSVYKLGNGLNCSVLGLSLRHEKATRQLLLATLSISLVVGALMERTWVTWQLSRFQVGSGMTYLIWVTTLMYVVDQRWYMFQNMGPSPSGRSGHAMASIGTKVYVLGGESFSPSKSDDPSITHVLDTSAPHSLREDYIY